MKKAVKANLLWALQAFAIGCAVGVLEFEFHFAFPEAVILVAVSLTWWTINKKLGAIKQQTDYLHTALNGLVLPRLTRVERRQRGWRVPEPPKEGDADGEYDDWDMFCVERPTSESS